MKKKNEHIVKKVLSGSIAEEMEITPGDALLEINGHKIEDIFCPYIINQPMTCEQRKRIGIIRYVDILVDGEYIDEQKDLTLKWRGSKNQRCIDVKQSLAQNKMVLYCD